MLFLIKAWSFFWNLLTVSIIAPIYFLKKCFTFLKKHFFLALPLEYRAEPSLLFTKPKKVYKLITPTPDLTSSFLKDRRLNLSFLESSAFFQLSRSFVAPFLSFGTFLKKQVHFLLDSSYRTFGEGFIYLRGLFIIFFVDSLITDDEPIWEPIEWSLVQTWIMFIFLFAWIAENLITSRFGSYTGRDKRIWFSWYKTFWWVELWYALSMGAAILFVVTPFYYELTYSMNWMISWWNWYSRVFFCKFIAVYSVILYLAYYLQITLRFFNWKKSLLLILLINFFIAYLIYIHFFMAFFCYFTDPLWHTQTRLIDYIQMSHEPNKWAWGSTKRDHFSHHHSSTVFWFKNDGPFAGAFLFTQMLFLTSLFFLFFYWLTLARRVYATNEITYTYTTYAVSSLRQFFYFFFLLFVFIFMSFIVSYWRFPVEFYWLIDIESWFTVFFINFFDYLWFLLTFLK